AARQRARIPGALAAVRIECRGSAGGHADYRSGVRGSAGATGWRGAGRQRRGDFAVPADISVLGDMTNRTVSRGANPGTDMNFRQIAPEIHVSPGFADTANKKWGARRLPFGHCERTEGLRTEASRQVGC